MSRRHGRVSAPRRLGAVFLCFALTPWMAPSGEAVAADASERWSSPYGPGPSRQDEPVETAPLPRYFPREEGDNNPPRTRAGSRSRLACVPRRVPVPTSEPDDPSYVGSAYGLGKPNYYGIKPVLGVDDPFGRSLLPYCR